MRKIPTPESSLAAHEAVWRQHGIEPFSIDGIELPEDFLPGLRTAFAEGFEYLRDNKLTEALGKFFAVRQAIRDKINESIAIPLATDVEGSVSGVGGKLGPFLDNLDTAIETLKSKVKTLAEKD